MKPTVMKAEDIIRITKERGATMAGPDHPAYSEGPSITFSSRTSAPRKQKDTDRPLTQSQKDSISRLLNDE